MSCSNFVKIFACWTEWRLWAVENLAVELLETAAFSANHFLEATVQLDGGGPGAFGVERNLSSQRVH
jgi:hypothetical protein